MADLPESNVEPPESEPSAFYRLGDVGFEPRERRLLRDGEAIPLQPRTCDTLLYLVERAGRLVEKRELLEALWEDAFVTENALTRAIKEIRRALGDDARRPRYIETVPRVGYRFVAEVEPESRSPTPIREASQRQWLERFPALMGLRRRPAVIALVGLGVLILVGAVLLRTGSDGRPTPARDGAGPTAAPPKLLVLPFDNLGPPEDAYFAAGMTDELIARLARIEAVRVVSALSARGYAGAEPSLAELESELGADYVIEGSVRWARLDGGVSRLRITPKLHRVVDRIQLWSGTFDRDLDDVFSIQSDIASRVIEELDLVLSSSDEETLAQPPTADLDAYQAWLKGLDTWYAAGFDLEKYRLAAKLFEQAAERDPGFLEPLVTAVHVYGVAFNSQRDPQLKASMRRALSRAEALAGESPEVELARCAWFLYAERSPEAAYEHCKAAADGLAGRPEPVEMMAYLRRRQGRPEETVDLLQQVLALSPRDAHTHYELGLTLEGLRDFERADFHYERASRLEPDNARPDFSRAMLRIRWQGDLETAKAVLDDAPAIARSSAGGPSLYEWLEFFGRDWEALHRRFEARELRPSDPTTIPYDYYARAFEARGDRARAAEIRRLFTEHSRAQAAEKPESLDALMNLAIGEALAGRHEAALAAVDRVRAVTEANRFLAPIADDVYATVLVYLGGHEEAAIDVLEKQLARQYQRPLTPHLLELNPDWDPLRGDLRFEQLILRVGESQR